MAQLEQLKAEVTSKLIELVQIIADTTQPNLLLNEIVNQSDKIVKTLITQTAVQTLEAVVEMLDWRNRKDGTLFHDGSDVVDWYDKKITSLQTAVTKLQELNKTNGL